CNYARDDAFIVSEIGSYTMRAYWAARVEEWARAGHIPNDEVVQQNVKAVAKRLLHGQLTASQRITAYRDESVRTFWKHPAETLRVFLRDIEENTRAGWNYFPAQLPANASLAERGLRASGLESSVRVYACWLVGLGFVPILVVARRWPTAENRRLSF